MVPIAIYVLVASAALVAMKFAAMTGETPIDFVGQKVVVHFNGLFLVGVFLYGVSFTLYTYLIAKYDLSFIVPLTTALVYVVVFTASFFILKETFSATKIVAIVMIVAGVILLNSGR